MPTQWEAVHVFGFVHSHSYPICYRMVVNTESGYRAIISSGSIGYFVKSTNPWPGFQFIIYIYRYIGWKLCVYLIIQYVHDVPVPKKPTNQTGGSPYSKKMNNKHTSIHALYSYSPLH